MLGWGMKDRLNKIGRRADPDGEFVRAFEAHLRSETAPATKFFTVWKTAAVSLSLIGCFVIGTGAYAYASDNVLPEHPLYPVKTALEKAEGKLALAPGREATIRLKMARRRLKEQLLLNAGGKPVSPDQMRRFVYQIERAIEANGGLPEKERREFDRLTARIEAIYAASLVHEREKIENETEKVKIDSIIEEQTDRVQSKVENLQPARQKNFEKVIERRKKLKETKRLRRQDVSPLNRENIRLILPDNKILNNLPE